MSTQKDCCIRPISDYDLLTLKEIIDANNLFPSDLLDEMVLNYFNTNDSNEYWFTYDNGKPIAIAYCALEKMTEGTWNLYLIAVHPEHQGVGYGTSIVQYIEKTLTDRGERILLVETSALESFEETREFYRKCGYEQEAQIRDFYQAGEDKIIFRKSLIDVN